MSATAENTRRRTRLRIEGTVQGVGFRPHVYRIARELRLDGYVCNDSSGVLVEVEGPSAEIDQLIRRIAADAPPLAVIERITRDNRAPLGALNGFVIAPSPADGPPSTPVTPDSATCAACLRELFDRADRRFRYPFINCTDCGPRFTIVRAVPYDRPNTTMAGFAMCDECRREYEDPADRRFHAQPNACPRCGPSVALVDRGGTPTGGDALDAAARALQDGLILAVKGIGGYHLACQADDERAVATLRARKHREDKPFALMAADLNAAARLVELDDGARDLLQSPARPIVLAPRRANAPVARAVAPGAPELGVMLPYSPLHHVLLAEADAALVMTSGNVSDEPIAYRDEDALARLNTIADLFLVHDRPIETRTDDSVLRAHGPRGPTVLRRSRGYVPSSLPLPDPGTPTGILACGAELKSTFCLAKGARAWVSHHIGDLENYETLKSFTEGIEHFRRLFDVEPQVVAHDLHPEYLSTKYALEYHDTPRIGVQHHHAHLAACLAEHGEPGPAIGAIFDGTGYGTDGTIWGGEILHGSIRDYTRVGHLLPVRLPGGANAIKQPWRMASSWLVASDIDPPEEWQQVAQLARSGLASPWTTSVGRLFDAVATLTGVRTTINYEGQAAIELEACCDPHERGHYPFTVTDEGVIDPRPAIRAIAAATDRPPAATSRPPTASPATVAARFHNGLARATVVACTHAAESTATDTVVLSGGVFANRRLLDHVTAGLQDNGLRVLVPRRLPVNDGGISYGQAAIAAARIGRL